MKALQSITAKSFVLFQDQTFKFKPGVTVVYGENKDAETPSLSRNAVGKSLLFSSLPILVYGTPPSTLKRDSFKSFLKESTAVSFTFKDGKTPIKIGYDSKGKPNYTVEEDGKPLQTLRKGDVKESIRGLFALSEEAFYSTVMVSIYRPSPLWRGSAAERYDFFKKVFELDFYDLIYKSLSKQLVELKSVELAHKEVSKIASHTSNDVISPKNQEVLERDLSKLEAEKADIIKSITKHRSKIDRYKQFMELYNDLNYPAKTSAEVAAKVENLNAHCEKLAADYKSAQNTITVYQNKLQERDKLAKIAEYVEKFKKEAAKLKKAIGNAKESSLKKKLKAIKKQLDKNEEYADLLEAAAKLKLSYDEATKLAKSYEDGKIESLVKLYEFVKHNNKIFKQLIRDKECPICKTKHEKLPKSLKRMSTDAIKKDIEEQRRIRVAYHLVKAFPEGLVDAKALRKERSNLREKLSCIEELKAITEKLRTLPPDTVKLKDRKTLLTKLKYYEGVAKELNKVGKKKYEQLLKYKEDMQSHKRLAKIMKGSVEEIVKSYKKMNKTGSKLNETLNKVEASIGGLKIKLFKAYEAARKHQEFKLKLSKYKKKLKQVPMIRLLQQACGPNGVRVDYIKTLVNNYVKLLNEMAPYIYSEPYTFSAEVGKRKFDIIVHRNGKPATDVKYLSGAECHRFLAISAVALRTLLPKRMRYENIIFDEIEGSSSDAEREVFINRFIPYLLKIIPSITLITPTARDAFSVKGAREIIVTKSKGKSTFREEFP